MIRPNFNRKRQITSYGVRVHLGQGQWRWVGSYPTRRQAKEAEAQALLADHSRTGKVRCEVLSAWFLQRYEQRTKASTLGQARAALRGFDSHFRGRNADSVTTMEAERWAADNGWRVRVVKTMFAEAVRKHEAVTTNPFEGVSPPASVGRRDLEPLTAEQVDALAKAAGTLGPLVSFAAYTGLRKGEVFGLEWRDLDLDQMRVQVRRAVYRGVLDLPKSGKPRMSALLGEARDALLATHTPKDGPVFLNPKGTRWSEGAFGYYWKSIKTAFGSPVQFHELRHFAGFHLWITLGMRDTTVATQLGHSSVRLLHELYGHWEVGALEEFDRVAGTVVSLRPVEDTA